MQVSLLEDFFNDLFWKIIKSKNMDFRHRFCIAMKLVLFRFQRAINEAIVDGVVPPVPLIGSISILCILVLFGEATMTS